MKLQPILRGESFEIRDEHALPPHLGYISIDAAQRFADSINNQLMEKEQDELRPFLDCPNCPNVGWYKAGGMVIQCEFCYTNRRSKFRNPELTTQEDIDNELSADDYKRGMEQDCQPEEK